MVMTPNLSWAQKEAVWRSSDEQDALEDWCRDGKRLV